MVDIPTVPEPQIIQGGMGVAVSDWRLARAVARRGQLGVVSGTGLDTVFVRRLQDGDGGGALQRAMQAFPIPGAAGRVLDRYYRQTGRAPGEPYQLLPMYRQRASVERETLTMIAAFCEVYLAKEGHQGQIGINLLTKVQRPNLATLYGAMLAGVDYVLMGAGIPREIPAVLDALAQHLPASMRMEVIGFAPGESPEIVLDPADFVRGLPPLKPPRFLPIVASNSLAAMLAHKLGAGVHGFIIEGPTAGGHNAPPRGTPHFNERGEPLYGPRDEVDLERIRELDLPFWLAGGTGNSGALQRALAAGAAGIQVGTLFAFCDESGLTSALKQSVLASASRGEVDVVTDPAASPTGYPFKVVAWSGDSSAATPRMRFCDLGYLRVAYAQPDGRIGYRCPSEPVDSYVAKGGEIADTVGRRCLCNALMANVGLPQVQEDGAVEPPLLTSGDDLKTIATFLRGRPAYSADDVIDYLLTAA
jgi:NAD(P)H-dependent flavin oxidoreductase YrpB (nitropropane dioxygenase family)